MAPSRTNTVVIGAGQAGLAMSRCLSGHGLDHVVLERGRVAERWRSERWDSLRLLTPNWQSRLPGYRYEGPDPDGYMTMPEVVRYLERYAELSGAPVQDATEVVGVEPAGAGYRVDTSRGAWLADNVVIATGYCDAPYVPAIAARLSPGIHQLVPTRYRRPSDLPEGGVLVVGASASGLQLADELSAAGRAVTIAAGRHTRLPRVYRGRDILWWLDVTGFLDTTADEVYDIEISRHQPSLQLVGRPDRATLDLAGLQARGVRVVGRAIDADGDRVATDDDLIASVVAADAKLALLLARIDAYAAAEGLDPVVEPAPRFVPQWPSFWPAGGRQTIDLRGDGIATVIWATGFRREYPWLRVPVLDGRGEIRHHGGVTPVPGLYVIGLQFLRRRKSAFLDGVGDDAAALAAHIATHRGATPGVAA